MDGVELQRLGYPDVPRSERIYRHAGDLGDAIYFMPVMKYLGGGTLAIEEASFTRQRLTPKRFAPIVSLFESQDYIDKVVPWSKDMREFCNGNGFRRYLRSGFRTQIALCDLMCDAAKIPREARDVKWIAVARNPVANVVFNRTGRWLNPRFPWRKVWDKYAKEAVFIGHPDEHRTFEATIGPVRYHPTPDLLAAAQVIAGSALFVGNQSCCYAIARGLQHPSILEVCPHIANCLFYNSGPVIHGWTEEVEMPDLI